MRYFQNILCIPIGLGNNVHFCFPSSSQNFLHKDGWCLAYIQPHDTLLWGNPKLVNGMLCCSISFFMKLSTCSHHRFFFTQQSTPLGVKKIEKLIITEGKGKLEGKVIYHCTIRFYNSCEKLLACNWKNNIFNYIIVNGSTKHI